MWAMFRWFVLFIPFALSAPAAKAEPPWCTGGAEDATSAECCVCKGSAGTDEEEDDGDSLDVYDWSRDSRTEGPKEALVRPRSTVHVRQVTSVLEVEQAR